MDEAGESSRLGEILFLRICYIKKGVAKPMLDNPKFAY